MGIARELAELGSAYNSGGVNQLRNRIINGAMMIDQRNAGAAVTVNDSSAFFAVDRFQGNGQATDGVFTLQRTTTSPAGFVNAIVATVTTADASIGASQRYVIRHNIEGFNVADLGWGTANAQPVTLSFWVRSSLTGTFGGSLSNSAFNRSYPFTYSISSANTYEYKTITIAGDTTGTWLTDNGIGIRLDISLGAGSSVSGTANAWSGAGFHSATGATSVVGTSGATFYITGVQLEKGSTATSFDYRPYTTELELCQRYTYRIVNVTNSGWGLFFGAFTSTRGFFTITTPVKMRADPTITFNTTLIYTLALGSVATVTSLSPFAYKGNLLSIDASVASGLSAGATYIISVGDALFSSEL